MVGGAGPGSGPVADDAPRAREAYAAATTNARRASESVASVAFLASATALAVLVDAEVAAKAATARAANLDAAAAEAVAATLRREVTLFDAGEVADTADRNIEAAFFEPAWSVDAAALARKTPFVNAAAAEDAAPAAFDSALPKVDDAVVEDARDLRAPTSLTAATAVEDGADFSAATLLKERAADEAAVDAARRNAFLTTAVAAPATEEVNALEADLCTAAAVEAASTLKEPTLLRALAELTSAAWWSFDASLEAAADVAEPALAALW